MRIVNGELEVVESFDVEFDYAEEKVAEAALLQEAAYMLAQYGATAALLFSPRSRNALLKACQERIARLAESKVSVEYLPNEKA